jgi:hypothetical protein
MDIVFSSDPTGGDPPDQCKDHGKGKSPEQVTAPKFSKIFLKKGEDEKNGEREKGEGTLGQNPKSHEKTGPKVVFLSSLLSLDTPMKIIQSQKKKKCHQGI